MENIRKDILRSVSDKKQKLFDLKEQSEFSVGEEIVVPKKIIYSWVSEKESNKNETVTIIKVNKKTLIVRVRESGIRAEERTINKTDVVSRSLIDIGENPFNTKYDRVRPVAFTLQSILFNLNVLGDKRIGREDAFKIENVPIGDLNWNPFVYDKDGSKQYYQRDFCWTLEDKQLLIESIYSGIDCGKILVRKRSWNSLENMVKNGETKIFFNDLVDGKQRLDAVRGFILNEYPDVHGNYYADLSARAQMEFTNHQLFSYAEMGESTTDDEVIYQFLKMNFTGVPQSQEHLDYVKSIGKLM